MSNIEAALVDESGKLIAHKEFVCYIEAALADRAARVMGNRITGGLTLNIALNRYRRDRCMFCGAGLGQEHQDCKVGIVKRGCSGLKQPTPTT